MLHFVQDLRKVCNDELYVIESISLELWHKRLRHRSEKGLQVLARNFLIPLAKEQIFIFL